MDSCPATQCSKEPETVASKQAAAAVQIKPSSITGIDFDLALAIEPTMAANYLPPKHLNASRPSPIAEGFFSSPAATTRDLFFSP